MESIVLASGNKGKLAEFAAMFEACGVQTIPIKALLPAWQIEETGSTLYENALIKARAAVKATGKAALADDSGLFVYYLGGEPGVYSQRYAGAGAADEENNALLLHKLTRAGRRRQAHFTAVLALVYPTGTCVTTTGRLFGRITDTPRGTCGFGYDPIFEVRGGQLTLAELPLHEKNRISHRAAAWQVMRDALGLTSHVR
ncbi:MAG: Non-canonical purine NTP pyrophosphatase [Firmicutes bacterium]|nr:Non-canonical purine NTP pyrophosphatase [Bacillota bacterium]